jgi:hypothetical protein
VPLYLWVTPMRAEDRTPANQYDARLDLLMARHGIAEAEYLHHCVAKIPESHEFDLEYAEHVIREYLRVKRNVPMAPHPSRAAALAADVGNADAPQAEGR